MTATEGRARPESRQMRVSEVRICGYDVRVAVWPGSSAQPPLLMFNGIGVSFELLVPLADALGDIEVIAFDVPGSGGSIPPRFPYRLWMVAVLAGRLVYRLGYHQVDVLGVSWGGAAAQQFAIQHPRLARRLILAATSPGVLMIPPSPSVLAKFLSPRRFNDPEYRRRIAGEIYGGRARDNVDVLQWFRPTSRRGYLYQQLALVGWSSLPWLPLVRQPTLVLAGDDDPVIPLANARLIAAAIPNSRLRVIPDGHLFLVSSAAESGQCVGEFLRADMEERT